MRKNSALLVVDVQLDFCPGGALAVPHGDTVVGVLNRYMELFADSGRPVYATRHLHPTDTVHFTGFGGRCPPHCVRGTPGAGFHPGLRMPGSVVIITRGDDPGTVACSAFDGYDDTGVSLEELLAGAGITQLYVGGLATDYCIKATVLDAIDRGFKVAVLTDAVRGVEAAEGDSERALVEMDSAGAGLVTLDMLTADRVAAK